MPEDARSAGSPRPSDAPDAPEEFDSRYSNYVLGILFLVYVMNFVDRQILSILVEPIKKSLGATDTQMGFLTGFAFAIFYTTFGIPLARWADHGVRRSIIAIGLTVWSVMTGLCGLAQNFVQLALARIGVGIGEAAGSPPAHSLISDFFPPERRATAFSIYNFGIPVGVMIGYLTGGWLDAFFGWRVAFMAAAVPGLVLALLLRFTVREPPRGMSEVAPVEAETLPFREVVRTLMEMKTFVLLSVGGGFAAFASYGFGSWVPAFLERSHGMPRSEIGTWIGLESGIGGVLGMLATGILADRLGRKDPRWYPWIAAISIVFYVPFSAAFLLMEDVVPALLVYFVPTALSSVYLAPSLALMHQLVGLRMRAVASAIAMFMLNLIGMGLGPQTVGILSDWLKPEYGTDSLRWGLLIALGTKLIAIALFLMAAKTAPKDLAARRSVEAAAT
ncbi:MAG: MFS transporter [bacterium]|nr:MFS transporter [bacterium]